MDPLRRLRNRLASPFALLLTAELVVVAACGALAWHLWRARLAPDAPAPAVPAPLAEPAAPAEPRLPSVPAAPGPRGRRASPSPGRPGAVRSAAPAPGVPRAPAAPLATPGLNRSPSFLDGQMRQLDRDEAAFEALEWRLLTTAMDAMRGYLERVVVPAIERAQHTGDRPAGGGGGGGPPRAAGGGADRHG